MRLNWNSIFAVLLMIVLVGCGKDESRKLEVNVQPSVAVETAKEVVVTSAKEVVVTSAKELEGIKAKKITWKKDGAKMVLIPANPSGTGIKVIEAVYDEFGDVVTLEKKVVVGDTDAFFMDVFEVTVGQFKTFLKSSGYEPKLPIYWNNVYERSPTGKHPMIHVSWYDATAYAKWAGKRLPTDKEWEFAARGGLVGKEYPWGDDFGVIRDYANRTGTGGKDKWGKTTAPVGSFKSNGYGLHDMAGNVSEWCQDWYSEDKLFRVLRGGSWYNDAVSLRVAYRNFNSPSGSNLEHRGFGFRCVSGFPAAKQ